MYLLNGEYRKGDDELFVEHRLRHRHKFMRSSIEKEVQSLEQALQAPDLAGCGNPRCQLCAPPLREGDIHHLYRSAGLAPALRAGGIEWIRELDRVALPLRQKIKPIHWIQHRAMLQGREQLDLVRIGEFLDSLHWPLYCLDFECFLEALPGWESAGVWEHIPFLFSLHAMDRESEAGEGGALSYF